MRCVADLRAKLPLSFVSFCANVADGDETTAPVATVKMAVPTINDRTFFILTLLKVKDFEGLDAVLIRRFTRRLHGSVLPALPLECLRCHLCPGCEKPVYLSDRRASRGGRVLMRTAFGAFMNI
jgi:hypothetical protein